MVGLAVLLAVVCAAVGCIGYVVHSDVAAAREAARARHVERVAVGQPDTDGGGGESGTTLIEEMLT